MHSVIMVIGLLSPIITAAAIIGLSPNEPTDVEARSWWGRITRR